MSTSTFDKVWDILLELQDELDRRRGDIENAILAGETEAYDAGYRIGLEEGYQESKEEKDNK